MATAAVAAPGAEEITSKALTWPEQARALKIVDQSGLERAADLMRGIKDLRAEVDATFDPICSAAFKAHREAVAAKRKAEEPLAEAEQILRQGITTYQLEQERIRQEQARKAREEAERIAREQRLAFEAEQRRLQEEQQRLEQEQRLADAVQAEVEGAAPEEVAAILETPAHVPFVAPVLPPPPPVAYVPPTPVTRPAGISKPKDNWSAVVEDKAALVRFVAEHPEWLNLLEPSTTTLNQLARAQKELMKIPGVRAVNNPNISVRRN